MDNVAETIFQVGQFSLMAIAGWLAVILFLSLVDHPPRRKQSGDEQVEGFEEDETQDESR